MNYRPKKSGSSDLREQAGKRPGLVRGQLPEQLLFGLFEDPQPVAPPLMYSIVEVGTET